MSEVRPEAIAACLDTLRIGGNNCTTCGERLSLHPARRISEPWKKGDPDPKHVVVMYECSAGHENRRSYDLAAASPDTQQASDEN